MFTVFKWSLSGQFDLPTPMLRWQLLQLPLSYSWRNQCLWTLRNLPEVEFSGVSVWWTNKCKLKNINQQWFTRFAHAWDVFWCVIVSVDQIARGKYDCKTVIWTILFYRSLVSESSVTGLGVHTGRWVYDNVTLHSLCYLARVRPVVLGTIWLAAVWCGWLVLWANLCLQWV